MKRHKGKKKREPPRWCFRNSQTVYKNRQIRTDRTKIVSGGSRFRTDSAAHQKEGEDKKGSLQRWFQLGNVPCRPCEMRRPTDILVEDNGETHSIPGGLQHVQVLSALKKRGPQPNRKLQTPLPAVPHGDDHRLGGDLQE